MKKNNVTISYAITACNEHEELERLLLQVCEYGGEEDEIVIQLDQDTVTDEVRDVINSIIQGGQSKPDIKVIEFPLNKDFASFKNNLKSNCSKDYIFQIDADEYLGEALLFDLPTLLNDNPDVDLFYVPRINIVKNVSLEYIYSQRWRVDHFKFPIAEEYNYQIINYPDIQARIFRNSPDIKWVNKVHERIVGHETFSNLSCPIQPNFTEDDFQAVEDWCIIHIKDIDRQIKQNNFYTEIANENR